MAYPPAPWQLQGYAIQTLHLLDIARSRPLVPAELEIISVLPGKTVGVIYVSAYGSGSVLEYNELIVVPALVQYAGKWGSWISHIYVDNIDSVAAGREILGLPKEMADFTWQENRVDVRIGDRLLCSLSYSQPSIALPLPFSGDIFSALGDDWILFKCEYNYRLGLVSGKVEVPAESPFASLSLGKPMLTLYCDDMRFVVGAPEVVGKKATAFSYG